MACETAVVASRVGGIPEVVLDGETGLLVDYDEADPAGLETGLAEQVNQLAADPGLAAGSGRRDAPGRSTRSPGTPSPSRRCGSTSRSAETTPGRRNVRSPGGRLKNLRTNRAHLLAVMHPLPHTVGW